MTTESKRTDRVKVLYSPNEAATQDDRGYYSIELGWTDLERDTRFSEAEAHRFEQNRLPQSLGQDRHWIDDPSTEQSETSALTFEQAEAECDAWLAEEELSLASPEAWWATRAYMKAKGFNWPDDCKD